MSTSAQVLNDPATVPVAPPKPHDAKRPNWFMRGIVRPLGFTKLYNFILWFILAGAMTGFIAARLQYLSFDIFCGENGAAPGECYWFAGYLRYKIGIIVHLASILPAGLLAVLQFTPFIRHRFRMYHRIAGYLAVGLGIISMGSVFAIADKSFGGTIVLQVFYGALAIAFMAALGIAVYNIRKKQIEQHRAWMLRAWVWAGSIITLRLIMVISALILSMYPPAQRPYVAYSCDVLQYIIRDDEALVTRYPICQAVVDGSNTIGHALQAAVQGDFATEDNVEQISAMLQACFPMGAWLAWFIHFVGTEIYLKLTPAEAERLRQISYIRQLEAGHKNPGNSGLTVERLGDARPWTADVEKKRPNLSPMNSDQAISEQANAEKNLTNKVATPFV